MSGSRPPRFAELLVRWFGPRRDHEYLAGDLAESYRRRAESDPGSARRWYRAQALAAIRRAQFWRGLWLDGLLYALRHGIRGLRSSPALTLVAIFSLALGIGSSTAIFSVMDRLLLRPLDVEAPYDLFHITTDASRSGVLTNPIWEDFRARQDFLAGAFVISDTSFEIVRDGQVDRILGAWVSGASFSTLGIGSAVGRPIGPADDFRGCPAIAVLGHGYWQSEYGESPEVIGGTIVLNDQPVEVVGVAPPTLRGLTTGLATKVYLPLCAEAVIRGSGSMLDSASIWSLRLIVRRPEGMPDERLATLVHGLAPAVFQSTVPPEWEGERRDDYLAAGFDVTSVARGLTRVSGGHAQALWMLWALGALVVLAACANLATLLLARGESRQREVAIQAALGADRWRIFGQSLTESLLLAAIGAALGLTMAVWASRALVALMSTRWETLSVDLSLDPRVLGFAVLLTTLTAALFGLGPALRTTRVDGSKALLAVPRSAGGSRLVAARLSVVVQVAMSVVLVGAAVLLGSTFWHLVNLDAGFQRQNVLVANVDAGRAGIDRDGLGGVYRETLDRLRADPAVEAASMANFTPISGGWQTHTIVAGDAGPDGAAHEIWMNEVSDGFVTTFGMRLIDGRDFNAQDVVGEPLVVLVNETLAREAYGTLDVLDRTLRLRQGENGVSEPYRIVGLVGDAKYSSLRDPDPPTAYFAMFQRERFYPWMSFQVLLDDRVAAATRAHPDGGLMPPSVQRQFADIGPDVRLDIDSVAAQVAESLTQERMLAILSALFGGAALFLCAIGLHGIVSYGVARRTHEISIRTALGATRGSVLRLVMLDAGRLVGAGALLGVAVSVAATRLVDSFVYGISAADPRPVAAAVILLLATAGMSCLLPARRAAGNDPIQSLRAD